MANTTIQLKRSSVAGKTPTTGQIDTGELALNITDQKLYSSNGTGVFQLAGAEWDQQIKINVDSTTDPALLITSTNAASDASPELELYRNSASPDDGDYLGQLKFTGENDTGGKKVYAKITGKTSDVTNGTEDGLIEYAVHKNGSITIVSRQTSSDLKLLNGTGLTVNGSVTVDENLTVDGAIDFSGSTDSILIPIGNTAQRPAAANGSFRYNTDDNQFEGYANGQWGAIAGGGGGSAYFKGNDGPIGDAAAANNLMRINSNTQSNNITVIAGENALMVGPITIGSGNTLTIDTGARVVIA